MEKWTNGKYICHKINLIRDKFKPKRNANQSNNEKTSTCTRLTKLKRAILSIAARDVGKFVFKKKWWKKYKILYPFKKQGDNICNN